MGALGCACGGKQPEALPGAKTRPRPRRRGAQQPPVPGGRSCSLRALLVATPVPSCHRRRGRRESSLSAGDARAPGRSPRQRSLPLFQTQKQLQKVSPPSSWKQAWKLRGCRVITFSVKQQRLPQGAGGWGTPSTGKLTCLCRGTAAAVRWQRPGPRMLLAAPLHRASLRAEWSPPPAPLGAFWGMQQAERG